MTNREAFNQYIRRIVDRQIAYMEAMSDEELVQYCIDVPEYHIGDKLGYFKAMMAELPVGPKDRIITWLGETAPETIDWEKVL